MACPISRSKVTTHTHSSQEEKRDHGHRLSPPSVSSRRGEAEPSNGFITTGSKLCDLLWSSSGPPSHEPVQIQNREGEGDPRWTTRGTATQTETPASSSRPGEAEASANLRGGHLDSDVMFLWMEDLDQFWVMKSRIRTQPGASC